MPKAISARNEPPLPWSTPQRRHPWEDFGRDCPNGITSHRLHDGPWWSGESVYAPSGQRYRQPEGPFFHTVFPRGETVPLLKEGDVLMSPAERRVLPTHLSATLTDDGCIYHCNYDTHGVYFSNRRRGTGFLHYEVEPEGLLWPDPERAIYEDWCAVRARIVAVHVPEDGDPYWE